MPAGGASACEQSHARGSKGRHDEPVRVAAASDLAVAFKELGTAFERSSGKKIEFTFGSTGLLAKQISEGAPYDVPYTTKGHVAFRPPVTLLPRRNPSGAIVRAPQSVLTPAASQSAGAKGTSMR